MQPLHVNYQHFKNGILVFNRDYEYFLFIWFIKQEAKTVYNAIPSQFFSQLREMRDWLSSLVKRGQENKIKLMNGT